MCDPSGPPYLRENALIVKYILSTNFLRKYLEASVDNLYVTGEIERFILLHKKLLQIDWLRAAVFQLNLKYLHVKITNLLRLVV